MSGMQYQQHTTTQGYATQQQASQVIYATQQYTTVTTVNNSQQQTFQALSPNTKGLAFGLPNDQDTFAESKDKRNLQYKSFDWSDPNKYESLRNILPNDPNAHATSSPTAANTPTQLPAGFPVGGTPSMYSPGMFNPAGVNNVPGFYPQGSIPSSPFTVPNNMHTVGTMPFTTPSTLPSPLHPTGTSPFFQSFPTQQFVPTSLQPQLSQQQLLQQQQFQQQQLRLQQQQMQQQQLNNTMQQQPQQPLLQQHLQQQQLQQQQLQQQQLQQQQLQQQQLQQQQLQQQQQQQQQLQQQQLQQQQLQQQQLHQQQLQQQQQQLQQQQLQQQQQQQQQQLHQPFQQQQQTQSTVRPPNVIAPPPSSVPAGIANMAFVPMLGSHSPTSSATSSIPTPISSTSSSASTSSCPSPVPISPPSPNILRAPTPVNPTSSSGRSSTVPNLAPPAASLRSVSPAILSTPTSVVCPPPFHTTAISSNYASSNTLYSETQHAAPKVDDMRKPDTSDDLFFQQMSTEKKRREEDEEARRSHHQPQQPNYPSVHVQIPTQMQTTSMPVPTMERESSAGMLQKPPAGRERGRTAELQNKSRQREEARIAREINHSPVPASPVSSSNGSAPGTPTYLPSPTASTTQAAFSIHTSSSAPNIPSLLPVPHAVTSTSGSSISLASTRSSPSNNSTLSGYTHSAIPPSTASIFAHETHMRKVASVDSNVDLLGLEPMTLQEMDEKRRAEIEKKVREELEDKHKREIDKLRQAYEAQKQQDADAINRLSSSPPPANRIRAASHSLLPVPQNTESGLAKRPAGRTLPPAPARAQAAANLAHSPKQTHVYSLAPPSPSLMVDNETIERRTQVKKDLVSALSKPAVTRPHANTVPVNFDSAYAEDLSFPTGFPTIQSLPSQSSVRPENMSDRRSVSFEGDTLDSKMTSSSVSCPICGEIYPSERVLAVHIDDSHGSGGMIGAHKKQVHFAGPAGNRNSSGGSTSAAPRESHASLDALDLSFSSPLGKSRSVDDMRIKDDDLGFGFEAFGKSTPVKQETSKISKESESKDKDKGSTLRKAFFGRSRSDRDAVTPIHAPAPNQILDLAGFGMSAELTPSKLETPSKPESSTGSSFFKKVSKGNSLTSRPPAPRPSILNADLMTGSPRPAGLDFAKVGNDSNKSMLLPRKKKKKDFVPFTPETAAIKIQATFRMMQTHKEYKKIIFRTKVVKELVTTEHTYVENIENVVKTFAMPLRHLADAGKPLISHEDISTMFSKIEDILIVNRALLDKLTMRIAKWGLMQKIGDVCIDVLSAPISGRDFRKVYNDYTITYNGILETLDRCCGEKSAFKKFIQNGEKSFWGSAGNTIQAFFILPVQRITRYILLFKEVIKYTNPTHPDYQNLCVTLREMESICIDVNESQRKEDTEKKRIQTLQAIQGKVEPRMKDLMVEGRYLMREGVISQFDVDDDQIKERYYFLFNDIILVTKKQKQKYLMRLHITLHNVRLKDIPDSQNFLGHQITNAFELHTPSKTVMFLAQTVEDKDVVLKELTEVISNAGGVTN